MSSTGLSCTLGQVVISVKRLYKVEGLLHPAFSSSDPSPALSLNTLEPIGLSAPQASSNVDPAVRVTVLSEHSLTCPVQAAPSPTFRWENMITVVAVSQRHSAN